MSYGVAAALQAAVYQRLAGSAALVALVGTAIYDAVPPAAAGGTYVSLGPEKVLDKSDCTTRAAEHEFVVSVVTDAAGFQTAKQIATSVSDALIGAQLVLGRGRLIGLWFLRAVARRVETGRMRQIDLTFRARVDDN